MRRLVDERSPFVPEFVVACRLLMSRLFIPLLVFLVVAWSHHRFFFEFRTKENVICKRVPRFFHELTFFTRNVSFPVNLSVVYRTRHPRFLLLNCLSERQVLIFIRFPIRDLFL
jgi:hypothetical protein